MKSKGPSPRAMWMYRLYNREYHHNLDKAPGGA